MFSVPAWDDDDLPSCGNKAGQSKTPEKIKDKKNKKKIEKINKSNNGKGSVNPSPVTLALPPMFNDSDDDDEGRTLSKKAKKRLKEKRRKQKSKFLGDDDTAILEDGAAGMSYMDQEGSDDDAGRQKKTKKRKLVEDTVDYLETDLTKVFQQAGLLSVSGREKGNAQKAKKRKLAASPPSMDGKEKGAESHSDSQKKKKRKKKKKKLATPPPSLGGDEKGIDSSPEKKNKEKRKRGKDEDALSNSSPKKTKVSHTPNYSARDAENPALNLANGGAGEDHQKKVKKRKRNKKKKASSDTNSHDTSVDHANSSQEVRSKENPHRDQLSLKSQSRENNLTTESMEGKKRKKKNSKKNKYKHLVKGSTDASVSQSEQDVEIQNSQKKLKDSSPIQASQIKQEPALHKKRKEKKPRQATSMTDPQGLSSWPKDKAANTGKKLDTKNIPAPAKSTNGNLSSNQKTPVSTNSRATFDRQKLAAMLKSSPARAVPVQKQEEEAKPMGLKERLEEELNAARFRYLNEKLYTCSGQEAKTLFKKDQEAFQVYHQGFQSQVARWPVNPLDVIIQEIKSRPSSMKVADFGCGDAKLARSVPNQVHSFDLVALNEHITVCDIAKVPLADEAVHVAVFCLSLMGTNLVDYLLEASRVLKPGGTLKIAEVASRLTRLNNFILDVEKLGFKIENKDDSNKMFILLNFKKKRTVTKAKGLPEITLPPCLYKKR